MTDSLIFPIGHYVGAHFRDGSSEPDVHELRIGWRVNRLERPEEFTTWAIAHGLPEGPAMTPWTLPAAAGAARAAGVAAATDVLHSLQHRDLVIEVDPQVDEAVEFAQFCRLRALHTAAGQPADEDTGGHGLGWAGGEPVLTADDFTFELWKWAPVCDSLWHACEIFAAARRSGTPADMLADVLRSTQILLAHGLAYLDEAREDWPVTASTA